MAGSGRSGTSTISKRQKRERRFVYSSAAPEKYTRCLYLHYYQEKVASEAARELCESFRGLPDGKAQVILCVVRKDDSVVYIEAGREVTVTRKFLADAERILGRGKLKIVPTEMPSMRPRRNRENGENAGLPAGA